MSGIPDSGTLVIYPSDVTLFELASIRLAARFGGNTLPAGSVRCLVSEGGFATVSATGLLRAIRATDFDQPADSLHGSGDVIVIGGTQSAGRRLNILGWRKPWGPGLDSVAYLESSQVSGVHQAGVSFGGPGMLVLTRGTVAPGKWTVEISPYNPVNPPESQTRKLFAADTVSVVVGGESPRLERWERVGVRIRAADGDDVVRAGCDARARCRWSPSPTPPTRR